MTISPETLAPLRDFVSAFTALVAGRPSEAALVAAGSSLLATLVARDDWLPPDCARPDAQHYQQFLLHADPYDRFSVVSFVWGPGQCTPVHNHTVWGLIGMLRGAEFGQAFAVGAGALRPVGPEILLQPGQVEVVSPTLGDVHRVRNAFDDRVSISIHVYGGNIGTIRRSVFAPDGTVKEFVSGYANARPPELWRG